MARPDALQTKGHTMLRLSSGLCVAAMLATAVPAQAGNVASGLQQAPAHQAQELSPDLSQEWSSAKKQKRKRAVTVYPEYYPPYRYGWRAADPSFDRDGRPYRNPFPGQCMVDLGYGRFESCDQVGGR